VRPLFPQFEHISRAIDTDVTGDSLKLSVAPSISEANWPMTRQPRDVMNKLSLVALLGCLSAPSFADDNCEKIRSDIDAKIKARGVPHYKLEVVDAAADVGGTVVGTCGGGTKKIVYWRLGS
jgi:hypothetical protein